jgi:zinc protease
VNQIPKPALTQLPDNDAECVILPNGLTVIVKEDHSAPVASVQAWVKVGSIHEDNWMGAGLSHILEHMLFKGTSRRSGNEIAQAIQDVGGYINAYTSFERTVYWVDTPSGGVETAIDVLADVMTDAALPEDEYESEQEVIRREFAMGFDDPDRMHSELLFKTAFRTHPFGQPVIGHLDIFNQLTRQDVLDYYQQHYVPNNQFFVVVGDVDAAAVVEQIREAYSDFPRKPYRQPVLPREPEQLGRREVHEEFHTEISKLSLAWKAPDLTHPDVPALDVLATILGQGRSARLYRSLREEKHLVTSIGAYCYTPGDSGLFAISADMEPEKREAATAAIFEAVGEIKCAGVDDEEVEKAKKMSLAGSLYDLTTMRGQASDLGSNWIATGDLDFTKSYLEALQEVTAEDVQRVANRYLNDVSLTNVSLNPQGSLAKKLDRHQVSKRGGVECRTLSNGLKLLVREDKRLPLVSAGIVFKAGLLAETAESNGVSALLSGTILKGTASRSGEAIADELESAGGSIGTMSGNNSYGVSVGMMEPDTEMGLDMLADVVLNANFPERELSREQEAMVLGIKQDATRPMSVASKLMREHMFSMHPYQWPRSGTEASVMALGQKTVANFHTCHAVGANGVLAVFGDVDTDEIVALSEARFGGMAPGEKPAAPPLPAALTGEQFVEETLDKEQAVVLVGFRNADIFSPDRVAIDLIDEACSDLASRLFLRIREELGLAYYVGSSQMLGLVPGSFVFYAGTSPEKADQVQEELLNEIAKLGADGLTQVELDRAKKTTIGKQTIDMQSNGALLQVSSLNELYGLGFDHHEKSLAEVESITLEQVHEVARKYLHEAARVVVKVAP